MLKQALCVMTAMLAVWSVAGAALAQTGGVAPSSVLAAFDLKKCTLVEEDKEAETVVRHCDLAGDNEFYVAEAGLHAFVGYGSEGLKQKAFAQTLLAFNTIDNVIEYRVRKPGEAPYAAILRYNTEDDFHTIKGEVLVVTTLQGPEACHIAYIDALATPDAKTVAQRAADTMAATFDCDKDEPKVLGQSGKSPM